MTTENTHPLQIVNYPHPTLRHKSKPIKRVDAELVRMVGEMFQLMYAARGVGLAANQVDLPVRLFIVNSAGDPNEGDEYVFINPVISRPKGSEEYEEGCLSLPGVNGGVIRPKQVHIQAYNLKGEEFNATVEGFFARILQHELDHLDGVLFIDRMSETAKLDIADEIDEFVTEFASRRRTGHIPDDETIARRLTEIEQRYCC